MPPKQFGRADPWVPHPVPGTFFPAFEAGITEATTNLGKIFFVLFVGAVLMLTPLVAERAGGQCEAVANNIVAQAGITGSAAVGEVLGKITGILASGNQTSGRPPAANSFGCAALYWTEIMRPGSLGTLMSVQR